MNEKVIFLSYFLVALLIGLNTVRIIVSSVIYFMIKKHHPFTPAVQENLKQQFVSRTLIRLTYIALGIIIGFLIYE